MTMTQPDDTRDRTVFLSRIPTAFDEDTVGRIVNEALELDDAVVSVKLSETTNDESTSVATTERYGFCVLKHTQLAQQTLALQTIKAGRRPQSKRKHILYIAPATQSDVCFLWTQRRCPYGDQCKFSHTGRGGLVQQQQQQPKKKQKCFLFRRGKCTRTDCPFSHDECVVCPDYAARKDSEKDCINWKTMGKCRKRESCPYRHDPKLQQAALRKKKKKQQEARYKRKQPLHVRVFGLNYETKEEDVRELFAECGPIAALEWPTFADSGRNKGYCGLTFQSPKAVAKAVAKNNCELRGRWLSVQIGKMLLDDWEKNKGAASSKRQKLSTDGHRY